MNDHLNWRYATQKFDPLKKVPEAEWTELEDVLRMAPSSFGLQPWKFVVVQDVRLRQQIRSCAWNQEQITDASHLVVFCALKSMSPEYIGTYFEQVAKIRNIARESLSSVEKSIQSYFRSQSAQEVSCWMRCQVYLALGMFLDECARRRIDACPIEGFNPAGVDEALVLDKEAVGAVVLCPVGYRSADDPDASLKKVRFEKSELIIER